MKKNLLLSLLTAAFSVSVSAQTIYPDYQDGKIWFKIKSDARINANEKEDPNRIEIASMPFLKNMAGKHRITGLSKPFAGAKNSEILQKTYLLQFADYANVEQIIASLQASSIIEYAEKVPLDRTTLVPNDPSYSSQQWGLTKINAATAWNYFSSGSNIKVAIVDNAIQRNHTDFAGNLWVNSGEISGNGIDDDGNGYVDDINGFDVADNDNNPDPPSTTFDHGTHCAGIAGARTNNSTGIASIGYSIKIMAVKASRSSGSATSISYGYDGVVYAASSGARVISLSWGSNNFSTTAQNTINWAYSQGCIIIAAAGNDDSQALYYPACYPNVISVAATTSSDAKAGFSNYGTWVTISAPGNNIYSTVPTNTYANMSGTSMACPMVAGLAGLMLSLNPGLTQTDIRNCITSTADNINSQNPSYTGKLGSGRINAANAMSCVSATLNYKPIPDFVANFTTVTAGGAVTFTDQTIYNPTTWNWTFNGGTPGTYNGKTPPLIYYNTPGTYNVTLVAGNSNGSNTITKTNYITVTAAGSCDSLDYPVPAGSNWQNYYVTATPTYSSGWVNGPNVNGDKQKAQFFDASSTPFTYVTGTFVAFGRAYSANAAKIVPVRIYDGTSGTPGTLLSTQNVTMGKIMSDVSNNYYTRVVFPTAVALPASKKFFISVDLTNLTWSGTPKDTLSILSNKHLDTDPSPVYDQKSTNAWVQYGLGSGTSWNLKIKLYIHPFLTNAPTVATYTKSASTICSKNSISYDATGSTYQSYLQWSFPGGTPSSSTSLKPTITYNTPGTYAAKLYVRGGGCNMLDSLVTNVTINATPTVSISSNPGTTICPSGSTVLTAGTATSYVWSPATGLSGTTGATVTASPGTTRTYNVVGTTGSCSNAASVVITVDSPPSVSVTNSTTSICPGGSVSFDATLSTNVTTFSWNFPGGTPATSNSTNPTVDFATAGTYTVTLSASNSCGSNNTYAKVVTVNPNPTITVPAATICAGKSSTLTASGANTYIWSPGSSLSSTTGTSVTANPTVTTTYTVTGTTTSTGCSNNKTVVVTLNPNPTVVVPAATICTGASTVLTASGSSTYTWSPGTGLSGTVGTSVTASPTSTSTYTITGTTTATGCTGSSSVVVTVSNNPSPTISGTTMICPGGGTTLTANGGGTYSWNTGASVAAITVSPTNTSTYTVTVNTNGCIGTATIVVTVNTCTGINQLTADNTIFTFYDPNDHNLKVNINNYFTANNILNIKIMNQLGQVVYANELTVSTGNTTLDVNMEQYQTGMYYLHINSADGSYSKKFIAN
ncbi:MAG: S8 family serine peptidase [Bacteroidota bacterium]